MNKRIEKAAFAVFKIDFPMLELDDWMHFSEKVKGIYYMRAEAAINAYQNWENQSTFLKENLK